MLGVVVPPYTVSYTHTHIYIYRESWVLFLVFVSVLWCAQIIEYIMVRWSYTFVCISHIIIIMQTYLKVLNFWNALHVFRYILLSVCLRLNQFSQSSFMQYMGPCVLSLPIFLMVILRICVLYLMINIKYGYGSSLSSNGVNGPAATPWYGVITNSMDTPRLYYKIRQWFDVEQVASHYLPKSILTHLCASRDVLSLKKLDPILRTWQPIASLAFF